MTLYIEEIIEAVMQKHKEAIKDFIDDPENISPSSAPIQWMEAKDIDIDSVKKVFSSMADETTNELLGWITTGFLDMNMVHMLMFTTLAIGFEIGYTGAEKQISNQMGLD